MTEGFYKYINDQLFCAPNFVEGNGFLLLKQEKDQYTYPIDGWYWFDSEDEAKTFFSIPS